MFRNIFSLLMLFACVAVMCGCEGDIISAPESPEEVVLIKPVVDLVSNPLGAMVKVFQPDLSKELNSLGDEIFSGITPVYRERFEAGSYLVEFSAERYVTKYLAMNLAHGDTNVDYTVDLELAPLDPPEPVTASIAFSSNIITLGETVNVTPTMMNGKLGILSMGGHQYFTEVMSPVFRFTPLQSGEQLVSFLAIGEGGDIRTCNRCLTVLADPETVALNAWIVGGDTVLADSKVYFGWAASANADSVTTNGYYTNGNIGLSGDSHIVIIQDTVLELMVWKDGEIKDTKSLEFFVQPPVTNPLPELTFYASAYEVENSNPAWSEYQVVEGQQVWLIWNVKFYDELSDEVGIDRMPTYGDLGPRGLLPVTVSSDTTFTATVYRDGQGAMSKMVHITVTDAPIDVPEYIDLSWLVDVWVGQRSEDPHQADLMSGIRLPINTRTDVWAHLEYSQEAAGQDDESCALGFLTTTSEYWAYLDDPSCPVFPDQGHGIDEMLFVGTVTGFGEESGRMVIRTGADFDCWSGVLKCTNPNSVHVEQVHLRIWLP